MIKDKNKGESNMAENLERRKAIMGRSIKLGHCACNPKISCPCDVFKNYNVCTCAGERMPVKTGRVKLMDHVRKAGCASKIGQAELKRILQALPPVIDPNVVLGMAAGDDAAVYRINDSCHIVQTVDVFTPCVNDAYLFGQIAAANCVSDIYAMGGKPLTALSIVGFPIDDLEEKIMEDMLRGGMDKLREAGCSVIGGHSMNDEEVKFGFAVTGLIEPENIVKREGARPGDILVLTKPLGSGMISFAGQIGRVSEEYLNDVGAVMAILNKDAAELMVEHKAHACTDITGFGLMGHLVEMILSSGVSAEIDMARLPVFAGARECLENDILPGAIERNQEYAMARVHVPETVHEKHIPILYDPQTSGGLLISLAENAAESYIKRMHGLGHTSTTAIGRIFEKRKDKPEGYVILINPELENFTGDSNRSKILKEDRTPVMSKNMEQGKSPERQDSCCCAAPQPMEETTPEPSGEKKPVPQYQKLFSDFMKDVNAEGLIDKKSKKLMAIALSIARSCRSCLSLHLKSALGMGISRAEIDEAAWLAISFSGSPAMMLYKDVCEELKLV